MNQPRYTFRLLPVNKPQGTEYYSVLEYEVKGETKRSYAHSGGHLRRMIANGAKVYQPVILSDQPILVKDSMFCTHINRIVTCMKVHKHGFIYHNEYGEENLATSDECLNVVVEPNEFTKEHAEAMVEFVLNDGDEVLLETENVGGGHLVHHQLVEEDVIQPVKDENGKVKILSIIAKT
jgi:hypothetical protein